MRPDPLLTVIIPTHGRPEHLHRAISSAVDASQCGDVEVVVVPNGGDETWHEVANKFKPDRRVHWHAREAANVSAARNYGLEHSTGEFVRFLDDDDYLHPNACHSQLDALVRSGADVCSGALRVVSKLGKPVRVWQQPATDDLVCAALTPFRCNQVGAHLFRRTSITRHKWNSECTLNEDVEWLVEISCDQRIRWVRTEDVVASWVQHAGRRLSRGSDPGNATLKYTASVLLTAGRRLEQEDRLTGSRKEALADGLWSLFQKGLRYDYRYWRHIASIADLYAHGRRPPSLIHRAPLLRKINPLAIETFLIPVRWAHALMKTQ